MIKKLHIKKGDTVFVNAGENKGSKGKVLDINRKTNRATVEGVNLVSKHTKPSGENKGGIVKKEAPIHISNLQLLDPSTGKPTRIGRRRNKSNKIVRYSVKSNEEIK